MATEKQTYRIYKTLTLLVDVEAASPREAYDAMLHMDDTTFDVVDCGYQMFDGSGHEDFIDPDEYE